MKRLSDKKEAEIKVWEYFCLKGEKFRERTDEDLRIFFEWSEQGKHKDKLGLDQWTIGKENYLSYANKLYIGKSWAGRTIHELWEPSFYGGDWLGWMSLLGQFDGPKRKWWQFWKPLFADKLMPREVVDFVKKDIFRGQDAEVIERCYQELLASNPQ